MPGNTVNVKYAAIAVLSVSVGAVIVAGVAARWRYYGEAGAIGRSAVRLAAYGLVGVAVSVLWLALIQR